MTKEVISMAKEAGFKYPLSASDQINLEMFAFLVAQATKEKAAQVCEEMREETSDEPNYSKDAWNEGVITCAAAIRGMK